MLKILERGVGMLYNKGTWCTVMGLHTVMAHQEIGNLSHVPFSNIWFGTCKSIRL